jgi:GGDEF domain-containing protein
MIAVLMIVEMRKQIKRIKNSYHTLKSLVKFNLYDSMQKPNIKNSKGMVIDGVFSSEAIDSSGEIVKLAGLDIASMEEGQATANYEHKNKDDGGFGRETVGRIIYVKKIFDLQDCDDDRQKFYYRKVGERPYLYGQVRLLDAAGHTGAAALAAQIRDAVIHDDLILVRYSVEGTTLEKENNVIKTSIGRKVALTIVPCNKTCFAGVVIDGAAPEGYDKSPQDVLKYPSSRCIGGSTHYECNPVVQDNQGIFDKLVNSLQLLKTMTAGSYDVAPTALTNGAALQREDLHKKYHSHIVDAIKEFDKPFNRKDFRDYLKGKLNKAALPEVSDKFLDHFVGIAEDYQVKKSDPVADFFWSAAHQLESELIDIRKALREELEGYNIAMPEVYLVQMKVGPDLCPAGRFMIQDGNVIHLEDYHGLLSSLIPEGKVTANVETTLAALKTCPAFVVSEHELTQPIKDQGVKEAAISAQPAPQRPAVFEYWRPGMSKPHIVEFSPDWAAIDGQALSQEELQLILENARSGLASITWRTNGSQLEKAEETGQMSPLRAAVVAGHVQPDVERAITKHVYEDHMLKGVGNKHAFNEFLSKKKPGAYGSIDLNGSKSINDRFGHAVGDTTIKSIGGALRDAAKKTGTVELFRSSGDKIVAHAPTLEDMHLFIRHARSHLENVPAVGGVHRPTFSIGVGSDYETADKALLQAKSQKVDPITGKSRYLPGNSPHFGHSLVPGSEGPLNLSRADT